jgi:hypothetical protein
MAVSPGLLRHGEYRGPLPGGAFRQAPVAQRVRWDFLVDRDPIVVLHAVSAAAPGGDAHRLNGLRSTAGELADLRIEDVVSAIVKHRRAAGSLGVTRRDFALLPMTLTLADCAGTEKVSDRRAPNRKTPEGNFGRGHEPSPVRPRCQLVAAGHARCTELVGALVAYPGVAGVDHQQCIGGQCV